jgi:hypothetical protein
MAQEKSSFESYLGVVTLVSMTILAIVFLLNFLFDPLWNIKGNRIFPENYAFNERHSKTNQYIQMGPRVNCIIFGSSRATLLNANTIEDYNCFNYAFSAGTPREFVRFAEYIRAINHRPKLVIVGVDIRNFSRTRLQENVPDFIRTLSSPPGLLRSYLSLRNLNFSIRTIFHDSPLPRYYTADFSADVLRGTPSWVPPTCFSIKDYRKPYTLSNLHYYSELLDLMQEAKAIGYVPPVSAWDIATLQSDGALDSYLEATYAVSRLFSLFYDFSIPSEITADPRNTYDGDHYYLKVNNLIARALNGYPVSFGISLKGISKESYKKKFKEAVSEFLRNHEAQIRFSSDCTYLSAVR